MTRENVQASESRNGGAALAGKYLTFRLGSEEFGLQIMKVQEIIGLTPITKLPNLPTYVRGIINLRGRIIPTIDLRSKFGMPGAPDTEKTCIIVVEMKGPNGSHSFGLVADEVAEVMSVGADQVEFAPEFGDSLDTRFIRGIGLVGGSPKILLDIDRVLTGAEIGLNSNQAEERLHG